MKKLRLSILWFVLILCMLAFPANASNGAEHGSVLQRVLFHSNMVSNNKEVFYAISDASQLAIDEHGRDGKQLLNKLRTKYKIKNIPKSVDKFDVGHGNQHRNYTHKGWTYTYTEYGDEAKWVSVRKNILLQTINQKFDFDGIDLAQWVGGKFNKYCDQCDAFGAMIYYVHMIQDHISNESPKQDEIIPLVKGSGQYGIIDELIQYSPILFKHEEDNSTYHSYMIKLDEIQSEVDEIYDNSDDLGKPGVYQEYHEYASELMDCLQDYVPLLIKNEPFFKKAFY